MLPGVTVCCYGHIMRRLLSLTRKLLFSEDLISVMEDGMMNNTGMLKVYTVKILKFGTLQTIAIIVLKTEKFDVTLH